METENAAHAFATLGHPARLAVFRLLMRFAPQAQRPSQIAAALGIKANTLSHYLAELTAAELIKVHREGRQLFYAVNLTKAEALIGYLALDVGRARPDLLAHMPVSTNKPSQAAEFSVLFLCSGNSARSIFAEALLRDLGQGRFRAYSAGTQPSVAPNPFALEVLRRHGHAVAGLSCKHISQFQGDTAPKMDFVFTVCDSAAAEECPPWRGQPITGYWGLPDPVKATGQDAEKALIFNETYAILRQRIGAFVNLPMASLSRLSLQAKVDDIGSIN